jgi:hypothetical protein
MPDPTAKQRQQQEFIASLAARLGITPEQLKGAIRGARIDLTNKAVAEGKLSREQADRIIEQLARGQDATEAASGGASATMTPESRASETRRDAAITDIEVSFKLDPRLTRSLYMGDRWVSPPTYSGVQPGTAFTVEARAQGRGRGEPIAIAPQWMPSDPEMVTVSPGRGGQVTITVQRSGESTLAVVAHGMTRDLRIKATTVHEGQALQVQISQDPVTRLSAQQTSVPQ